MQLTEIHEPLTALSLEQDERSPGLHVSEIINDYVCTLYGGHADSTDEARQGYFEQGYLWERLLSRAFADRAAVRPGELAMDDILLSPDGVNTVQWYSDGGTTRALYGTGDLVVEEYKCTSKSSSHEPTGNTRWMMQIQAYCLVLDTNECIMRILHLQGNYRDTRHPVLKTWRLEFTDTELADNWRVITQHAQTMKRR